MTPGRGLKGGVLYVIRGIFGIYGKNIKCSTVDNEVVSEKCPDKTKTWCGNIFHGNIY
jgi:hypothetical protein